MQWPTILATCSPPNIRANHQRLRPRRPGSRWTWLGRTWLGRTWLKAHRVALGCGGAGQGVKAIWVAGKPAGRLRANRLEPSALHRPAPPGQALVPGVAALPVKPRIANPHTWTAHGSHHARIRGSGFSTAPCSAVVTT